MDATWWRRLFPAKQSPVAGTGPQRYAAFLQHWLSPALRERDFIGSNGRYTLRCQQCWVLLSLQKSVSSTAAEMRFTVNLLVVNKAVWIEARARRPHLPERPSSANMSYGIGAPNERLGKLTPDAADKWWLLSPGSQPEDIADEIVSLIDRYGLPWLRTQMAQQGCTKNRA